MVFVFFFQAEDGIRVGHVTGVQTCALPIWPFGAGPNRRRADPGCPGQASPDRAGGSRSGRTSLRARLTAYSAASVRWRSRSFRRMCVTWFFTVFSATPKRSPISRLLSPSAISPRIRRSRGVSVVNESVEPNSRPSCRVPLGWGPALSRGAWTSEAEASSAVIGVAISLPERGSRFLPGRPREAAHPRHHRCDGQSDRQSQSVEALHGVPPFRCAAASYRFLNNSSRNLLTTGADVVQSADDGSGNPDSGPAGAGG